MPQNTKPTPSKNTDKSNSKAGNSASSASSTNKATMASNSSMPVNRPSSSQAVSSASHDSRASPPLLSSSVNTIDSDEPGSKNDMSSSPDLLSHAGAQFEETQIPSSGSSLRSASNMEEELRNMQHQVSSKSQQSDKVQKSLSDSIRNETTGTRMRCVKCKEKPKDYQCKH